MLLGDAGRFRQDAGRRASDFRNQHAAHAGAAVGHALDREAELVLGAFQAQGAVVGRGDGLPMASAWGEGLSRAAVFPIFVGKSDKSKKRDPMEKIISGIQQVGVGIPDVHEAFAWYRRNFGMDIPMFDAPGIADLMLPYTGNMPQERHAILAINMQGGGGFEIWQYLSRVPEAPKFELQLGDLGIYVCKIKSKNVRATYSAYKTRRLDLVGELSRTPWGTEHFFVRDPWGNLFEVEDFPHFFSDYRTSLTGGPSGAMLGVSNIDKSMAFYEKVLGYDTVLHDEEGSFADLAALPGGTGHFRRVLLGHGKPRTGPFSELMGPSRIELVQALDRPARKIYENRFWGDLGFIHLCFDVVGMERLRADVVAAGQQFTVDSGGAFDMGEAAGRFAYTEDPDGTLIELVETYKIPIAKQFGIFLDLTKRAPEKPLPKSMLKALALNRVKG